MIAVGRVGAHLDRLKVAMAEDLALPGSPSCLAGATSTSCATGSGGKQVDAGQIVAEDRLQVTVAKETPRAEEGSEVPLG